MVQKLQWIFPSFFGQKKVNAAENRRPNLIFDMLDSDKNEEISVTESANFGFTTLGDKSISREEFLEKYNEYKDKTSTIEGSLKDFEDVLYQENEAPIFDITLSKSQQKELLKRMEMYDAYRKTLKGNEIEDLKRSKSEALCLSVIRDEKKLPKDYQFPKDFDMSKFDKDRGLPDYKYTQYTKFMNEDYEKLKKELRQGKNSVKLTNGVLVKLLKLTSPNDFESDGKISGTRQGNVGDCWLLSSLNNYVSTPDGEQNIKDRIKDNGDGSYTFTFNNPIDQSKKETFIISKDELAEYGRSKWETFDKKRFSTGDIDMRITEVAIQKLLSKYLSKNELKEHKENQLILIEGGAYLKEAIIHKALGYTDNIKYYQLLHGDDKFGKGFTEQEYDFKYYPDGKIRLTSFDKFDTGITKLSDLINNYKFKSGEITCSIYYSKPDFNKFLYGNHAYNILKINQRGIFFNNPSFSSFPHFLSNDSLNSGGIDMITYYPKQNRISVKDCK